MTSDHPTWRERVAYPGVRVLIVANVAMFAVQMLTGGDFGWFLTSHLGLSREGVLGHGWIWQFITYQFLHDERMWLHIVFNMMMLFSFGRDFEMLVGTTRLVALYLVSGILGGAGWLLISGSGDSLCIGASGAVCGVAAAFAAIDPKREMTYILFPIPWPITMKTLTMVLLFALGSVIMLVGFHSTIAHAAHLSGGLVGYAYGYHVRRRMKPGLGFDQPALPRDTRPDQAEVDRILEKINSQGIDSLTRRERDMLDRASRG